MKFLDKIGDVLEKGMHSRNIIVCYAGLFGMTIFSILIIPYRLIYGPIRYFQKRNKRLDIFCHDCEEYITRQWKDIKKFKCTKCGKMLRG